MADTIFGRAWLYGTGDPSRVEVWHHSLEPTDLASGRRSVGEWAHEHFSECYDEDALRELFGLPKEGAFQVLFKGTIDGTMGGSPMDPQEWDEWFDVEEVSFQPIPSDYLEILLSCSA